MSQERFNVYIDSFDHELGIEICVYRGLILLDSEGNDYITTSYESTPKNLNRNVHRDRVLTSFLPISSPYRPNLFLIMHRLFGIHEILDNISEAVLVQPHRLDRRSLVSVLQTCRSFSVVATRLLWQDLHNLAPLILTMPDDLLEVERWDPDNPSSKFKPRSIVSCYQCCRPNP